MEYPIPVSSRQDAPRPAKRPGRTLVRIHHFQSGTTNPSRLYRQALLWARILLLVLTSMALLLTGLHVGGIL